MCLFTSFLFISRVTLVANGEGLNMNKNMHDNPVGKDIYLIKNKINGKVYVGQSLHPQQRFKEHCYNNVNSIIHKAIKKYGRENFEFVVLEKNVLNYNEREKYWINFYNSIVPHGYNITEGGENPPVLKGICNPCSLLSYEQIIKIKNDLKNTSLSYSQLGEKYKVSKKTILRINHGISYYKEGEIFPLRKIPNTSSKLSNSQIKEIIEILKYTYEQYSEIAEKFHVSESIIKQINLGTIHSINRYSYPIRKYKNSGKATLTYNQVTEIHELLKNTDLSMRQIGRMYKVNHNLIILIKSGKSKRYYREGESYPLC